MARKKQEAQELLAPDPFMEKATSGMNWLEKNIKVVVGVLVVGLGAIVGAQVMMSEGDRDKSVVTMDLAEAIEAFEEATSLQTVLTSTAPEGQYASARDKLSAFRSKHAQHPAAAIAAVYEGELARRLGEPAKAQALFETYLSKSDKTAPLRFMALEGAGYAYEAETKLDEALAKYEQLASEQAFYRDYAFKHKARVQMKKGDKAGAIATYQALVEMDDPRQEPKDGETVKKTPLKSFAEERLETLR